MAGERRKVTFREVFALPEFLGLWVAYVLSVAGDQFARVALSLLVYDRTGSAWLAALTYAMTFIGDLVGGVVLGGWADRLPRRRLMVVTDLLRAVLVGLMAVPGQSIALMILLLFLVQVAAGPFNSARLAIMPSILSGDRLEVGNSVMQTTFQIGLVAGYPLGAVVVTWLGAEGALAIDAVTFLVSAALIAAFVTERRAEQAESRRPPTTWSTITGGARVVWGNHKLRALLALACVSGFYIAPEGLVVPYADQIGASTAAVGLLLAANPLGSVIGMLFLARFVTADTRLRLLAPLAVATSLVLLPTALAPGIAWSLVWWTLAGLFSAHDMITLSTYQRNVPDHVRGQALGFAAAGIRGAQGIGVLLTGALAELVPPAQVIGLSAAAGVLAAVLAARAWQHATTPTPDQR